MEKIREQIKNPMVTGIAGLVVGLFVGLVILGWLVWPVQWKDASTKELRPDLQEDYLWMAVQTFARDKDIAAAQKRWQELGTNAQPILDTLAKDTKAKADVDAFKIAVGFNLPTPGSGTPASTKPVGKATAKPGEPTSTAVVAGKTETGSSLLIYLGVLCLLLLIIGGAVGFILFGRNRGRRGEPASPASQAQEATRQAERTNFVTQGQEPPVAQFMTTYMAGDDLYDDSFSIDSPSGEFLGECGVGISETIGVGDPKKVTAFEVWLFDKNDIQTVTKVLMSSHAFNDTSIHQKLESKGEPVLGEAGKRILLETQTLQLEARVVDLNYGQGPLPSESFFDRLTLELAIWPKKQAA
jgi:hypothetical protein